MPPRSKTRAEAEARLRPGDIVLTTMEKRRHRPVSLSGALETGFRAATKKLQGQFTHAGLYAGDGKMIELRHDTGLRRVPLSTATRNRDFVAVRPRTDKKKRVEAAQRLETVYDDHATGRKEIRYSSLPFLLKTVAEHVTPKSRGSGTEEIEKNRFLCSNLVQHAYPGVNFMPRKGRGYVIPADFLKSKKTRIVAAHTNPKRHDKKMINSSSLDGFGAEVERQKVAIIGALGTKMLTGGLHAAKALGKGEQASRLALRAGQAMGGGKNLARAVGAGTLGVGGLGGLGAVAAARR